MPSNLPAEPAIEAKAITSAAAHRQSVVRGAAVVVLWLATWPLRAAGEAPTKLGLDLALALLGWWAVRPGHRHGEKWFGEHGHWTSVLDALPIGFAIAAAVELFHMIKG